ncbi:MAG: S-layer homology domain-containing protein [Oscillospiraceae bacterium]|nr:S-layer homology domain-containing protein [Oscillospiraceae bacterium]
MKRKLMALALMLSLVLALVPVQASAAQEQMPEPVMEPMALTGAPALPQAATYKIEMTSTGPGKAELYADHAGARESVYFLADPDPGYKVSFAKCGYHKNQYDLELYYIGSNVYEIVMPDGDVKLDLEFVKLDTKSHDVKLTVSEGGMASVDQKTAKKGESLFVEVITTPGYTLSSVRAKSGGSWLEGYYLGKVGGAALYEIFMPDADVEILVDFTRNGPYAITPYVDAPGGKLELSHTTAYELETVTVTARPDRGYQVASIGCYHSQLTRVRENVWTFAMPKFKEEVHVRFEAIVYPVTVTTETPMGGTASLDTEGATIGQTVTLTCQPDEGYRVARITGAKLTDNGDNTYTFVMDNAPVELKVLFLRENNPFLDVNETHFYHESVLWAVENGITNGVDATHFGPMSVCNRAQVVTFLWRAAGSPEPQSAENPFTDVKTGTWYTDAVLWAVEKGITNGLTADTFGPNTVCNRAQVVTFLHRANGSPEPEGTDDPFTDVAAGSFYAKAVLWALENGVTTGASHTTFNPNGQCLRAQVVTFLYRADQLPEPAPEPEPDPLPFPEIG